ncbi:DUF948 domain-containing protein [Gemmatimonas phototrophica]|uniref:DUF948 domain-containing protein n=1 Tax=Gemmatimonas phototrophica TaxID=1379270 RepID=A0A143BJT9_9BACT|nr:DUF948 domain-containing protein [Gemmatimonas phototrophica]AMW04855.1 hypothetical protein GEMMAAP_08420 [Gemmatimonas phototrophica]
MALVSAVPQLLTWSLMQVVSLPDTIIARTIPDRGVLEWTSGILQIVVLLLAVGALVVFILLLAALREGVKKLNASLERIATDTRPILANANAIVGDARDMVATVKRDVQVVSDAAAAVGDTILDAAEITAQRVDEVNAVLDVIQDELEETAITAVTAIRGVRLGANEMLSRLPGGRRKRRRPRDDGGSSRHPTRPLRGDGASDPDDRD